MKCCAWVLSLSWIALAGCGEPGDLRLVLTLPDQAARDQTRSIRVLSVEPGSEAETCAALLDGSAIPGQAGYSVEEEIEFDYPVTGTIAPLRAVGPGRRLFYAVGLDAGQARILAGCTDQVAGHEGPAEVVIALHWVEECAPTNGGVETCDGLDNDCDDSTDEGSAAELCPARDHATARTCQDGACTWACDPGWFDADQDWSDGCECQPTLGGVEWCDGVDNDCDGMIDGPGCQHCTVDADCAAAGGPCLRATCNAGVCETEPYGVGEDCDDGDGCTLLDECDAAGECVGTPRTCNDGIDCTDDRCDPAVGQCAFELREGFCLVGVTCYPAGYRPLPDGCLVCDPATDPGALSPQPDLCDDGQFCDGVESCRADGACTEGAPPCTMQCVRGCDEERDQCVDSEPGEGCDDGIGCTQGDACDGAGGCAGTPLDAWCGVGARCAPACSLDPSGCAFPLQRFAVSCDQDVPLDAIGQCRLDVGNLPIAPECLACAVDQQYPVVFAEGVPTEDAGGCHPTGWTMLLQGCSQFDAPACPLSLDSGPCCTQPDCQSIPPDNALAIRVNGGMCAGQGIAFARTVSLVDYGQAYLCFQLYLPNLRGDSWAIQVEASDPSSGTRVASTCLTGLSGRYMEVLDYCLPVPPEALSWQSAQLVLRVQSPNESQDPLYLRGLRVLGMPATCTAPATLVASDFVECDGTQIHSYPPWDIPSGALCGLPLGGDGVCAETGGLVVENEILLPGNPGLDMYALFDLSTYPQGASLCWVRTFFSEFASRPLGDMHVVVDSPAGQSTVYAEDFSSNNQSDVCERICVDLDAHGVKHSGSHDVQVGFHVFMNDGVMGLNLITLTGLGRCAADGTVGIGPVAEIINPDSTVGLAAPVTDLASGPEHPVVNCSFLGLNGSEDDFRFVLP